jgi:hypothetical protein
LARCFSCSARHESGAFYAFSSFEGGGPTSHCFDATLPLDVIVDRLNTIRPSGAGAPRMAEPDLGAGIGGDARTTHDHAEVVSVAGELCTPPVREAVRSAWGIEASEFSGCSEGTYAFPCGVGEGMHVADDLVILEPADADGASGLQTFTQTCQQNAPRDEQNAACWLTCSTRSPQWSQ